MFCSLDSVSGILLVVMDDIFNKGKCEGYVLSICLNPVLQKTLVLPCLRENEVNRCREYYLDVAGKGVLVSRVLVQLGVAVVHLTHAGGLFRDFFLKKCSEAGLEVHAPDSRSEIRFCHTLLNRGTMTTTEIVEESGKVGSETEKAISALYSRLLPGAGVVVISGTKAAGYSLLLYPGLVREAKAMGIPVILDIKGEDLRQCLPSRPDIIKPNYSEFIGTFFSETSVYEGESGEKMLGQVENVLNWIYQKYGTRGILTRGKYATLFYNGKQLKMIKGQICGKPVSTLGCGDAFTAGLAAGFMRKTGLEQAIELGHDCARKNAMTLQPGDLGV